MKYILYKTTNLVNGFIYIGVHQIKNEITMDPWYIGCGVNINKPSSYNHPKTAFQYAVNEFGTKNFRREILSIYLDEDEAYDAEAAVVNEQFLARPDVYNMVLGGKYGCVSCKIKCYSYDETGKFLQGYESLTKAAESVGVSPYAISKAVLCKHKIKGRFWNTDKMDQIDISNYVPVPAPTIVYRYLVEGGTFDKEFRSFTQASIETECTLVEITRSARIGYRVENYQFCFIKAESYDKAKSIYLQTRPVYKYDSEGNFLEGYETQKQAEWANPNSNITKSIKNKKPCNNGFLWSLEELPKFCSTQTKKRKVGLYDKDGNFIKEYNSVREAKDEFPALQNSSIKSEKLYKKQYIFKYI